MGVRLVPHDPRWGEIFDRAEASIRDALGGIALSIDHVGSTAIPGIDAKPVIDILVLIERYDPEAVYRTPLESLGYMFDHRDAEHVFLKGHTSGMATQIHVVEASSADPRMMVTFRDYLRTHPDEGRRYQQLKHALAERHSDGSSYAAAKSEYVWEIVRRSRRGLPGDSARA